MEIKFTIQGLLIYVTMLLYLLAFVAYVCRERKLGMGIYAGGFVVAAAAVAYRAWHVGHAPLSNLFEVFLFLGMLMFPLTLFCRHVLRVGGQAGDMLIGMLLLFPCGFVFGAEPRRLIPALQSPLFVPHVAAYMTAYAIMAKAAVLAATQLLKGPGPVEREDATYRLVCLGFPLLTMGLVLGAWWAKLAWGDYWSWDPKEMWSLASWGVYVGYFHFRYMFGRRFPKANAVIVVLGMIVIAVALLWVNLSRLFAGLHSYA